MGIISARVFWHPCSELLQRDAKVGQNSRFKILYSRFPKSFHQCSYLVAKYYFYVVQKAIINGKEFEITSNEHELFVNGNAVKWDLVNVSEGYFHILHDSKGYRAEVVKQDAAAKTVVIKINGHSYSVALKDQFDLLLEKMGMSAVATSKINNVKAPMPGLIIDLKVKVGDSVKIGDQLLILEAMKMENILKAQGEGIVKSVKVKKGDSVEKGQILVEF